VIDQKARELASGEAEMLRALAAAAMNQMALRLYRREGAQLERSATRASTCGKANRPRAQRDENFQ